MSKQLLPLDVSQLEPIDNLDKEELAMHNDLCKGKLILRTDKATKDSYSKIFKTSNHKRKALSLRMLENDYIGIKTKALELGMPYQVLINSVIHRYLIGDLR